MAVSKTKFINYVRCPRYVALDKIYDDKLSSKMSIEEYKKEELEQEIKDIIGNMFDEEDNDLINKPNEQLETMMPYYKEVELLAGEYVDKVLDGTPKYSKDNFDQESFDFLKDGIRYLCYVDIYNDRKDTFDIIEVKATTNKKYIELGKTINKEFYSCFYEDENKIYRLLEEKKDYIFDLFPKEKYLEAKQKLFDRYTSCGHYVYDLAVQRYIIEQDLKTNGSNIDLNRIRYYLAVLNTNYIFPGKYDNENNPIYETDENGNEIISLIDFTNLTKEYMDKLKLDFNRVETYIKEKDSRVCNVNNYCEYKKTTCCKFIPMCFNKLPEHNSIFAYLGVRKIAGLDKFELINSGKYHMLDIPEKDLMSETNIIQRQVVSSNIPYIDKEKIKKGLDSLEYPIYHLDFETFPCPLPRFKGEKCYTQSPFQFSLHIEKTPGVCDKEKDNYSYLAKDNIKDYRREIGNKLCEWINIDSGGTVLAHNVPFERARLRELSTLFLDEPEKQRKLLKMACKEHSFDTLYLVRNNKELYTELGIDKNIDLFNFYHPNLYGSYSIKKVLPIFSNLSYKDLEVKNGTEALVTYARFSKMDKGEYDYMYHSLIEYCKQDTWAMVEILKGLRNLVK